jgi:hypothetical protein
VSTYRQKFMDPHGARYGIPTYPWRMAPAGLATRRQLTAAGLRPGGQPVVAQVMWYSRRHRVQVAYLYAAESAKPKREASPAQVVALSRALAARRRCPGCGQDRGYVISARGGICHVCDELAGVA